MITKTPISAIAPPIKSNLSGITLSIFHPHRIERTINIPPYAAYTRPKLALGGCNVGITP